MVFKKGHKPMGAALPGVNKVDINNGITLCEECHSDTLWHENDFVDYFQLKIEYFKTYICILFNYYFSKDAH